MKNKIKKQIFKGELPVHIVSLKKKEIPNLVIKTKSMSTFQTEAFHLFLPYKVLL